MTTTINNEHKKLNVPNKQEKNQTCLDSAEREGLCPKGNVPNLRFPEFQGEWEKCKLVDIITFSTTRVNSSELNKDNYVSTDNILQDYQGIVKAKSVPEDVNVVSFSCGDVLISNIRPYLKKVWKATFNGGCSSDVFVLKANDNIESDYLHYVIANDKFINFVMSGAKGVKMPRGDKKQMETYSLSLPQIQEQHKIARLLSLLDERISTQNKIIDKLQSLIKGLRVSLMQIENGNIVHLGEIAQIYQPQTISSTELTEDGFLVYGANGIIGKYKQYNHKTEQICITCRGNTCGMVNYTKPMSWITGNAMVINTDEHQNKVCKRYLYHYLSVYNFNSIISGSGQPQIVRTPLEKLKVPLPTFLEQKQKATFLDKIQGKIEISNKTLNLYLQQKQYLLRQMFI